MRRLLCWLKGHPLCVRDEISLYWLCRCGRRSESALETLLRLTRG